MHDRSLAIAIRDLGKYYVIRHNVENHSTLAEAVISRIRHPLRRQEREVFWALRGVDLEVHKGDVVGIIGRNGAGKSTLLKVLSRITTPSTGEVDLYGRVGSLLEVGTGFHPELTGRENIYLNGAILGMRRNEIRKEFDAIVDFAGVEQFLDTPVKRYSSGMYVRLAFGVAAHLRTDILLVDEVLAVGDAGFQKKCIGKMEQVASGEGRTVLFVSHNMGMVRELCRTGVLLDGGRVATTGSIDQVIGEYQNRLAVASTTELADRTDRSGRGNVRVVSAQMQDEFGTAVNTIPAGSQVSFTLGLRGRGPSVNCLCTLFDGYGNPVTTLGTIPTGPDDSREGKDDCHTAVCELPELLLMPGRYRMNVMVTSHGDVEDHIEGALFFEVEIGNLRGRPIKPGGRRPGAVIMPQRWTMLNGRTTGGDVIAAEPSLVAPGDHEA